MATGLLIVIIGFVLCKNRWRGDPGVELKLYLGAPPPSSTERSSAIL